MAQTTYATMFVWAALTFLDHFDRKKKKEHLRLLDLSASPQVKSAQPYKYTTTLRAT